MQRIVPYILCLAIPCFYGLILQSSTNENCPPYLNCSFVGLDDNKTDARTAVLHIWPTSDTNETKIFTHYFISTASYNPTFVAIVSDSENGISLTWDGTSALIYGDRWSRVLAVSIQGLYQYNDAEDVADVDRVDPSRVNYYSLIDYHWLPPSINSSNLSVKAKYCMAESTLTIAAFGANATFCFMVRVYNSSGRERLPPATKYSGVDNMVIEVELGGLKSIGNQTRYALDMQIVSNDNNPSSRFTISELTNINDEYTPGVFRTVYIQLTDTDRGFVTWRPVSYRAVTKDRSAQTQTITNGIKPITTKFYPLGGILLSSCFESSTIGEYNVTLGYPKDKFYSGFASWSFEFGTDKPPDSEFSGGLSVMIILSILVPIIGILIVAFFLIKRKFHRSGEVPFEPLVES